MYQLRDSRRKSLRPGGEDLPPLDPHERLELTPALGLTRAQAGSLRLTGRARRRARSPDDLEPRVARRFGVSLDEIRAAAARLCRGAGVPFHSDGQAVIKERIYLDKADPNTLDDEITVIDHALTRPWVKKQKATRNPNPRPVWLSDDCAENNPHVRIGGEPYYLSADGKLMPSKKGQPPPDLSYFNPTKK